MNSHHGSAPLRRLGFTLIAAAVAIQSSAQGADWPRFRGPDGMGVSATAGPTKFSQTENMQWKVELPGPGYSSPIVVGDKVFVTCYSGYGVDDQNLGNIEDLKRHMVCVNRRSGEIIWEQQVAAEQPEDPFNPPGVSTHGYASHTPVSDGERVYAFFGKSGLIAFDLNGEKLWQRSVGKESGSQRWGSAASPILAGDVVIVNAADEGQAVVAIDKHSGDERWRKEAAGLENSWSTPLLVETSEGQQVAVAVMGEVWSFDPKTGKFNWFAKGSEGGTATHSLIASDGVIYSIGDTGVALSSAGGDDAVVWEERTGGSFVTPLLLDGHLYYLGRGAILNCIRAKDGRRVFRARLTSGEAVSDEEVASSGRGGRRGGPGGGQGGRGGPGRGGPGGRERGGYGGGNFGRGVDYASPVAGGDKIYVATQSGVIYAVAAGRKYELLAKNDIGDTSGIGSTPALSHGQLFIRSNTHLYCFSEGS